METKRDLTVAELKAIEKEVELMFSCIEEHQAYGLRSTNFKFGKIDANINNDGMGLEIKVGKLSVLLDTYMVRLYLDNRPLICVKKDSYPVLNFNQINVVRKIVETALNASRDALDMDIISLKTFLHNISLS